MGRHKNRAGKATKARNKADLAAEHAWEKVNPAMTNARQRIAPAVDEARTKIAPAMDHARNVLTDDVAPRVGSAVSSAMTASEPYRAEAKRRGTAAVAALKGEVETRRRRRRWPGLLFIAALGAGAVAAYRYLKGGTDRQWEPMPSTTPPPRSDDAGPHRSNPRPTQESDRAGAGPDEAIADEAATSPPPSQATTPDDPTAHTEAASTSITEGRSVPPQKSGGSGTRSGAQSPSQGARRRSSRSSGSGGSGGSGGSSGSGGVGGSSGPGRSGGTTGSGGRSTGNRSRPANG
jgi:uncharacterized membrane protein YgcG